MQENKGNISRSGDRIPNLKSRGRINRQKLLHAAKSLLRNDHGSEVSFNDVFAAAAVSRGSAYRIYDGMDDLLQDLTCVWINEYTILVKEAHADIEPATWMELLDSIIEISARNWMASSETLNSVPRYRSDVPDNYKNAMRDLMKMFAGLFNKYFDVPHVPDWLSILGVGLQLSDTIYANAMQRDGKISNQSIAEAQRISRTYLAMHLPETLPTRSR